MKKLGGRFRFGSQRITFALRQSTGFEKSMFAYINRYRCDVQRIHTFRPRYPHPRNTSYKKNSFLTPGQRNASRGR
jgi:hypothetical protein